MKKLSGLVLPTLILIAFVVFMLLSMRGQGEPEPQYEPYEPPYQAEVSVQPPTPSPPPVEAVQAPSEPPVFDFVEYWLARLTIEEKIGQLFILRLPRNTTEVTAAVRELLEDIPAGGVILFGDNVFASEQVRRLIVGIHALSPLPMFIAVDEEGGRVSRIGQLFGGPMPSAFEVGQSGDTDFAFETGRITGERLGSLGINMNFAPVADIWSNPANAVIGDRAFGHTAETVSPMVSAAVRGLRSEGIMAVVKHFPGHGDTYEDSHFQLAFHTHGRERFDEKEALPFASGIEAGADGVMIAHISTPAVTGHSALLDFLIPWIESGDLPATFSDYWLDVLRGEMGFDGLIITDALEMRALTDHFSCGQIALGAFLAGADILLVPRDPQEAFDAMINGFHAGLFGEERLDKSLRRILAAKEEL